MKPSKSKLTSKIYTDIDMAKTQLSELYEGNPPLVKWSIQTKGYFMMVDYLEANSDPNMLLPTGSVSGIQI